MLPSIEEVFVPAYWSKLCPHLHISNAPAEPSPGTFELRANELCKDAILSEGYFCHKHDTAEAQSKASELARGIMLLHYQGWPATFILAFDESWTLANELSCMMENATGNRNNCDILAWYIDPSKGHSGFSPHRDRTPDNPGSTFRADGTPLYSSAWLALSDAHARNSCIHVVPKDMDAGYLMNKMPTAEEEEGGGEFETREKQEQEWEELDALTWDYFSGADNQPPAHHSLPSPPPLSPPSSTPCTPIPPPLLTLRRSPPSLFSLLPRRGYNFHQRNGSSACAGV
jgi:hypothetical protein